MANLMISVFPVFSLYRTEKKLTHPHTILIWMYMIIYQKRICSSRQLSWPHLLTMPRIERNFCHVNPNQLSNNLLFTFHSKGKTIFYVVYHQLCQCCYPHVECADGYQQPKLYLCLLASLYTAGCASYQQKLKDFFYNNLICLTLR